MSIDNVLYHVGPGFEVSDDEGTIIAKMPAKTFKLGETTLTFEVDVLFHDDGEDQASHVFVDITIGSTEVYEGVDEYFEYWANPQEIRDFVKKVTDKFKSEIMKMNFSF